MAVTDYAYDTLTPNSVIEERAEWVEEVYSIDEQNYVHGGLHGYANVPHEQLTNRTAYLKAMLENADSRLTNLSARLDNTQTTMLNEVAALHNQDTVLQEEINRVERNGMEADNALSNRIVQLSARVDDIEERLNTHVHNYAGSDSPGGDALTLRTTPGGDRMYLVGVTPSAITSVQRSTTVQVIGSTVKAAEFDGDLRGSATMAGRLKTPFNLTVSGDVSGLAVIDGSVDVNLALTLSRQPAVHAGWYGPREDITMDNVTSFIMPAMHINASGIVTDIEEHVVTLPSLTRSRTTGALQADGKLLLIGAEAAEDVSVTHTQEGAYVIDGQLYSLDEPVVSVYRQQDIVNKTYNGFTLGSACERGVDNTPGGTLGSQALITSDAVAQALLSVSTEITSGLITGVTTGDATTAGNLLVADKEAHKMGMSSATVTADGELRADTVAVNTMKVANELNIPGGKLWIDTAVVTASADTSSAVDAALETLRQRISRLEAAVEALQGGGTP